MRAFVGAVFDLAQIAFLGFLDPDQSGRGCRDCGACVFGACYRGLDDHATAPPPATEVGRRDAV